MKRHNRIVLGLPGAAQSKKKTHTEYYDFRVD